MSNVTSGRLEVIHGCMFSGKTEELISRLRLAKECGRRVRAFKHAIDDRYDPDHLITHGGERFDAVRAASAAEIETLATGFDIIGIDEGHFFGRALIESALRLRAAGKHVIVVGLENDAWGRPFTPMPQLAALAQDVLRKRIACAVCQRPAPYTQRMAPVMSATMVGGVGEYEPRCRKHFAPLPPPAPPLD